MAVYGWDHSCSLNAAGGSVRDRSPPSHGLPLHVMSPTPAPVHMASVQQGSLDFITAWCLVSKSVPEDKFLSTTMNPASAYMEPANVPLAKSHRATWKKTIEIIRSPIINVYHNLKAPISLLTSLGSRILCRQDNCETL